MPPCCWISVKCSKSTVMEAVETTQLPSPQSRSLPSISATPFRPEHFQTCLKWVQVQGSKYSKYTGRTGTRWSSMVFKWWDVFVLHSLYLDVRLMLPEMTAQLCTRNLKWIALNRLRAQVAIWSWCSKADPSGRDACSALQCLVSANSISVDEILQGTLWWETILGSLSLWFVSPAKGLACEDRVSWIYVVYWAQISICLKYLLISLIYLIWHSFPTKWN